MAVKYHISDKGPRRCKAEVRDCPYGRAGQEHYSTAAEAHTVYEKKLSETFGVVSSYSKIERIRQNNYQDMDNIRHLVNKVTTPAKVAAVQTVKMYRLATNKNFRRALKSATTDYIMKRYRQRNKLSSKILKRVSKVAKEIFNNADKILMTKYYVPDIHSDKWKAPAGQQMLW